MCSKNNNKKGPYRGGRLVGAQAAECNGSESGSKAREWGRRGRGEKESQAQRWGRAPQVGKANSQKTVQARF